MAKGNPHPNMSGLKPIRTKEDQPSPEQKKAGWIRRQNQAYWIAVYFRMSYADFIKIRKDLEMNPDNYNMSQVTAMAYVQKAVKNERVMFDNLDRTEGKAIQKIQNEGGLTLKIIRDSIEGETTNL